MTLIKNYKERKLTTADIKCLNYSVICILVLIAITSIVWSTSMYIICGDFNYGIFDATVEFQPRDFQQLTGRSQEIYKNDLWNVLNKMNSSFAQKPKNKFKKINVEQLNESNKQRNVSTAEPKKIAHLFQISRNEKATNDLEVTEFDGEGNTWLMIKTDFDLDSTFLSSTVVEMHHRRMKEESPFVQFLYNFPYFTEIVAIIWTAMCLLFQSGANKHWGLPKPWQIVVPSILVFLLMSVATLVYAFLANIYTRQLCTDLKRNLTTPDAISCGMAISVLRPRIRFHELSHDTYFNLFRISYIIALVLWIGVLTVMLLRYAFALDFQLIDVKSFLKIRNQGSSYHYNHKLIRISSDLPPHRRNRSELTEFNRSEEDFHSALSRLSEPVAAPLLEHKTCESV